MERFTMLLRTVNHGKPSINMGHLFHGYFSHNQKVVFSLKDGTQWRHVWISPIFRGPGAAQSLDLGGQFGPLRAELSGAAEEGARRKNTALNGRIRRRMEYCGSDTFLEYCGLLMEYIYNYVYIYNYIYIYTNYFKRKRKAIISMSHLL